MVKERNEKEQRERKRVRIRKAEKTTGKQANRST